MPRKCVSGADYPTAYRGQVIRLAEITTDVAAHYYAEEETDYAGNHYLPGLIVPEPIHHYRSLQADSASMALASTPALEVLLFAEKWDGAAVRILDYFTAVPEGRTEACELIRGLLNDRQANERMVLWTIIPASDLQNLEAPNRNFSRTCTWRFKSEPCGYAGGLSTCAKTWAECTTRGRTHRFNGFLQVNATLEKIYEHEPPEPTGPPPHRPLPADY
jgi:hypothetical protein